MLKKTRKVIAIVSGDGSASSLAVALKKEGNRIIALRAIVIKKKKLGSEEVARFKELGKYRWIFFSSRNAVDFFVKELRRRHMQIPSTVHVAAVGPETAQALKTAGIKVNFVPKKFSTERLVSEIGTRIKGKRILFPRSALAPHGPIRTMISKGAKVDVIHSYTSMPASISSKLVAPIKNGAVDYIVFTSPSGIYSLMKVLRIKKNKKGKSIIFKIPVVCIGPVTASAARRIGFNKIHTAKAFTAAGIAALLRRLP